MKKIRPNPLLFGILLIFFSSLFYTHAWVVDDAFITIRTVDNFVSGYGLTWNPVERVQGYSNPLWMFLLSFFYYFTHEIFYTLFVVSWALCIATFLLFYFQCAPENQWKASLLILFVVASKTVMDYSSSGLENPLSYLLAGWFYGIFLIRQSPSPVSKREVRLLFLIASLAFLNRQDALLLYFFPLASLVWEARKQPSWWKDVFLGLLPAILWSGFSLFYYGFLFPNTAYAKVFSPGVAFGEKIQRGWLYFQLSLLWDSWSHFAFGLTFLIACYQKNRRVLLSLASVFLYFIFIFTNAAISTYMASRFFAIPFMIIFFNLLLLLKTPKSALPLILGLCGYLVFCPVSSLRLGTAWYQHPAEAESWSGYSDAIWHYHNQTAVLKRNPLSSLRSCSPCLKIFNQGEELRPSNQGPILIDHAWFHAGNKLRQSRNFVQVGGALKTAAIGFFGFAAGPEKFIIDTFALTDPLLARLPAINLNQWWEAGHFLRQLPDGYLESVEQDQNLIRDPQLAEYYEKLRRITRGPLWSWQRFKDIVAMNLGQADPLLKAYVACQAR